MVNLTRLIALSIVTSPLLAMVISLIIVYLPQSILSKSKLLRRGRMRVVRMLHHFVDLTMKGPLVTVTAWFGKKLFRGRLSSKCRPPTELKAKPASISEATVTFAPNLPFNPFHEENYIVQWKRESDPDAAWISRPISLKEDCKDASGDEKKGEKFELGIDGLPETTAVRVRICGIGYWGAGPWSREVTVRTLVRPNPDFGYKGPLGPAAAYTGSGQTEYRWAQTRNEIHVKIPVGEKVKGKDIKFKCLPNKLELRYDNAADGKDVLLSGYLTKPVTSDEVTWYIEESKTEGRYIQVTMFKQVLMERWSRVFDGDEHPEIDISFVLFFVDPLLGGLGDLTE